MKNQDDFYVGYHEREPAELGKFLRWRVGLLLLLGIALVAAMASSQEELFEKVFEFDASSSFEGRLQWSPAPTLSVNAPGGGTRRLWLVAPKKFGLGAPWKALDGKVVVVEGHLLYRGDHTMLEVTSEPSAASAAAPVEPGGGRSLGHVRLRGEIVDSKCFLGAMNPGRSKVHRACAVRCISGGIPAALWAHGEDGDEVILLVDENGASVGDRVLDLVAEAVQIEGDLWRYDDLLVLRSDPASYRRISEDPDRR